MSEVETEVRDVRNVPLAALSGNTPPVLDQEVPVAAFNSSI